MAPIGEGAAGPRPFFGWSSCAAPFAGALAGLAPLGRIELIGRVLIGIAAASAVGMLCAAIAIARRERPWWLWAIGLLLNAYPFLFPARALRAARNHPHSPLTP